MLTCDGVRLPQDAQQLMAGLEKRGRGQPSRSASAAYNPAARLGTGSGEGARAYVQRLAQMRAEDEMRRAIADGGPRRTAQASTAGGCPVNFRC